jgi:NAD(P)-dependent dehydrogenase (short-subunit alcohol dehydrogenase family)
MNGKVCLITGATSGLGFATARRLVAEGATVVIAGRTPARCEAAVARLRALTASDDLGWVAADLASPEQVRRMAEEFTRRHDRLDVLINNAGLIAPRRTVTAEGVELTLAVNHLAPFLLTTLLAGLVIASAPARVVNVSSVAHERARLDFSDLEMARGYLPFRAYARSKLANLLFTYELARRLDGTGVTVNAVDPGLVRTGLGRGNGPLRDLAWGVTHFRHRGISLTPEQGAETIFFLACSTGVEGVTGKYFSQRRPVASSEASRDITAGRSLWTLSERWAWSNAVIERGSMDKPRPAPLGTPP